MEQSTSWEANSSSAIQDIPRIFWNPKVRYYLQNSPRTCSWARPIQSKSPAILFLEDQI